MLDKDSKLRFVVSNFADLESQLERCLSFIPFVDNNKQVISPKFIPIILESCGLVESIFKEIEGKKGKRFDLKEYSRLAEPHLFLEEATTIFLNPPILFLNPFKDWIRRPPTWWQAYNNLKHDRLNSYDSATYENTIMALAGLQQVISRNVAFVSSMLAAGWFNSDSIDVGELVAARVSLSGVPLRVIPVESKFFVSPLHSNFVVFEKGQPTVENCDFTNRVKGLLTVYEWF